MKTRERTEQFTAPWIGLPVTNAPSENWERNTVSATGCVLTALGAAFIAYQLRRRAAASAPPAAELASTLLAFHRKELERQRDALRSVPIWYLGPLVPGLGLFFTGGAMLQAERGANAVLWAGFCFGFWALVFGLIAWLNLVAARELDRQVKELDAMERAR